MHKQSPQQQYQRHLHYVHQSAGNTLLQPRYHWQATVHDKRAEIQSAINPTPRSPDPGYLEALNGYFPQSQYDYIPTEESRSGNVSQTEDEEDEEEMWGGEEETNHHTQYLIQDCRREAARRLRRRSRSVNEALSSVWTPLGSPKALEAEVFIPPANEELINASSRQPHISYMSKRRRHSCVEPNTKEFQALAAIFGWVTMSAQDAWPKILGKQLDETTKINAPLPTQNYNDAHPAVFESDDNLDLDGSFRYGEVMEWGLSCESRDSEFTDSCFQSPPHSAGLPSGSMDFSVGLKALGLESSLVHHDGNYLQRHQAIPLRHGSGETVRGCQAPMSVPRVEQNSETNEEVIPSALGFNIDGRIPQSSMAYTATLNAEVHSNDKGQSQSQDLRNIEKAGRRQRSVEFSLLCRTAYSDRICMEIPLESGASKNTENLLMSPLSFSSGKDSGYMSLACSFIKSPSHTSAATTEKSVCDVQREQCCLPTKSKEQIDDSCINTEGGFSVEPISEAASTSQIPPRCPENDAQGYDHSEDEGPDTIVYAPFDNDQLLENCGPRPIIAATIAKLIEKLTHQYGMDSGFVSDFFLTFRLFMSPMQLCKYLIQRYLWSLEQDSGIRHIVRVRTFVVIRYWINKHFEDDFLPSKALRFQMESFLREMRSNPRVQASSIDGRIILILSDLYKRQRRDYKAFAEQKLIEDQRHRFTQRTDQEAIQLDQGYSESEDAKVSEIERLGVSAIRGHTEYSVTKPASSDIAGTAAARRSETPIKGRHRASTLAGVTSRSMVREPQGECTNYKSHLSNDSRTASMSRQMSEGGAVISRERRLSTSSIKTHKSGSTWSTKMTMGINKLRQKSEDIYQQIVQATNVPVKSGDNKTCVCWTPAYTGITEHHALNTARSYPCLRPSVIVASVSQEMTLSQSSGGYSNSGHLSNKSIKRLKSSVSLGRASPVAELSPVPSPTKNQFSSISARHSRSNSNTSMGYHPNPDCPFHVQCLGVVGTDISKKAQESLSKDTSTTLQEALQDDFSDILPRPPLSRVPTSIPSSPAYCPWFTGHQTNSPAPMYKPFILYYRSQLIAQQLCLLEQHFLEQVKWDELLEVELTKAGRSRNKSKWIFPIGGYLFRTGREKSGVDASNERSNMLCMWVASEVVSTHPIEDRVRVIEKFIRIAQYRNYNSFFHLVMGLGSSHLRSLRRTWSRVRSYEMRILQEFQDFISPYSNWGEIRKAMNQVDYQETLSDSMLGLDTILTPRVMESTSPNQQFFGDAGHIRNTAHSGGTEAKGCIPFLGLFVFDLTHISVSSPWYLPQTPVPQVEDRSQGVCSLPTKSVSIGNASIPTRLQAPEPKDVPKLIPTGTLLVHFHRYQLIAKTIKWFMAFQRRSQKYTFQVDSTLYSKCFLLRVLSDERVRELADTCEGE
ncbi:hypothetical protein BGX27_000220 [Mortierella sp. AM989]|nr:hypothetical protein BGX27_000220 [Mortierella sp. AM989]